MTTDKQQWLDDMTAAIKKLEKARTYLNRWQDELEEAEAEINELAAQTQMAVPYNVPVTPGFDYATQGQE